MFKLFSNSAAKTAAATVATASASLVTLAAKGDPNGRLFYNPAGCWQQMPQESSNPPSADSNTPPTFNP